MKRCHASQTGCQEPALGLPSAAVLGKLSVPLANHVSAPRGCSPSACRHKPKAAYDNYIHS